MNHSIIIESTASPVRVATRRFGFLYICLAIVAALFVTRSFYLQVVQGSAFLKLAEGNRVAATAITAPRGIIYDRHGIQLVENIASTDLVFDPLLLPSPEEEAPLFEKLPEYLGVNRDQIQEALNVARQKRRVTVIASALDHDTVLKLEEAQATLPGIRLVSSLVRKYPFGPQTAHVIGYTSPVSSAELEEQTGFLSTDITGKIGLEKKYEQQLHGQHGVAYQEVNAEGHPQKDLGAKQPTPGSELQLGLDINFQKYIYQLFEDRAQLHRQENKPPVSGAVVALDPRTGSIRALVSYPSYDPNIFSQPSLKDAAPAIFKEPLQPLFNRGTDGAYPPGSTIKPLLAAAALEEGVITPTTNILSTGKLNIGPWEFPDWKHGGHGQTDVFKAIAESVNTYFYLLAGGDETRSGLGVIRIKEYLDMFGWGKPSGIDLPTEANGFLPSPEWKENVKKERWYIGDTYHLGIGQGDVLATPLQLTTAIGAVATGNLYRPHISEAIKLPDGTLKPTTVTRERLTIDQQHLNTVRQGMQQTISSGSGRALSDLSLPLAGKTGTAQIGGINETHAWFTSYGPFDSPELVLTVLLERGGEGDKDAVPFSKNIWQWWIDHREQ